MNNVERIYSEFYGKFKWSDGHVEIYLVITEKSYKCDILLCKIFRNYQESREWAKETINRAIKDVVIIKKLMIDTNSMGRN